jgi:23S rRNA (uracil1939-C5)-methyltransferase
MDPVRAGCSEEVLKAAAGMNPKRIVYVSCNPATFARDAKILKSEGYEIKEIQPVDMFPQTMHVEAIVLLSKLDSKNHISVELPIDDMDLTSAESKATYKEIQNYVLEKFGFKVSNLYIAQVKEKCGIKERENYNKSKKEDLKQPICPIEKEEAIKDAFRYFQMI